MSSLNLLEHDYDILLMLPYARAQDRLAGLRHLLGAPATWHYHEHGQPFCLCHKRRYFASAAHTDHHEIIAISQTLSIGVDIERVDRKINIERLVTRFWPNSERVGLRILSPDAAQSSALRQWVRREAMVKSMGKGLARHLNDYEPLEDIQSNMAGYKSWVYEGFVLGLAWRGSKSPPRIGLLELPT
ncbi:MAG: 4'-phosphopantetheinyl transferase family protein [Alphaproteobacteria bacterium]